VLSWWTPKQNCIHKPHALRDFYFFHTNDGIKDGDKNKKITKKYDYYLQQFHTKHTRGVRMDEG